MGPQRLARLLQGRIHYGWVVVAVMFTVILATVGVRAAPGVLIVPLEQAFGWNAAIYCIVYIIPPTRELQTFRNLSR